jgi:hypothetical protein
MKERTCGDCRYWQAEEKDLDSDFDPGVCLFVVPPWAAGAPTGVDADAPMAADCPCYREREQP